MGKLPKIKVYTKNGPKVKTPPGFYGSILPEKTDHKPISSVRKKGWGGNGGWVQRYKYTRKAAPGLYTHGVEHEANGPYSENVWMAKNYTRKVSHVSVHAGYPTGAAAGAGAAGVNMHNHFKEGNHKTK